MATGSSKRDSRVRRDRAQSYRVRQQLHTSQLRRRRRDNLVAGVAGGVLVLGILAAQAAYFTAGPGAPEPEPTGTSTPTGTPAPSSTPTPTDTP